MYVISFFVYWNQVKYSIVRSLREIDVLVQKIDNFMLTMHRTLVTDRLTYVQNILQPIGPSTS